MASGTEDFVFPMNLSGENKKFNSLLAPLNVYPVESRNYSTGAEPI